MRVRGCDRKCDSCALFGLCGGIEQYGVKGYRCLEAGCELEFPAIKRMQECSACGVGKLTWDLKDEEVARLVDEVANLGKVKVQPIELSVVQPIVSLKDPTSCNFDPLRIDAIIVMFEDLFDENIRRGVEKVVKNTWSHNSLHLKGQGRSVLKAITGRKTLFRTSAGSGAGRCGVIGFCGRHRQANSQTIVRGHGADFQAGRG